MPSITVPAPPPLVRIPHVELIHTGQWAISTGVWTVTRADLQAAVAALDCPAVHRPGIKIGHTDGRFTDPVGDGEPLLGFIDNLAGEDDWNTLVGDYAGVPAWLGGVDADGNSVISSAYPHRSVEGIHDFRCQIGHTHPFVLTAVALLGATPPGIGTLQSLPDLMALYGVAASGPAGAILVRAAVGATTGGAPTGDIPLPTTTQATAGPGERSTMPNPSPAKVAAGVTVEDVRRAYYDDAKWSMWITEVHLDPLQLIVVDDDSGERYRVPIAVTGEDTFAFGDPIEVLVRYVDAPADGEDASEGVAASTARMVYASRAESRPGSRPNAAEAAPADPGPTVPAPAGPVPGPPDPPVPAPATEDVPAAEPDAPTNQEDDMSLSAIRARLGLADDADEAAVLAALDARLPGEPDASTEPETPAAVPEPQPVAAATKPADKPALPEGVVVIDEATLNELRRNASLGAQAAERQRLSDRDRYIDDAVAAGKIAPARKAHWVKSWEADPDGTKDTLASLEAGLVVPIAAAGTALADEADPDLPSTSEIDRWARQLGVTAEELAR